MTGSAHYLNGLEGCSQVVHQSMQNEFASIISTIVSVIKYQPLAENSDYVHLVNSLCWSYTSEDHVWLSKVKLGNVLLMGNGDMLHPMRKMWGRTDLLYGIKLEDPKNDIELCLPSYIWQAFNFYA